MKAIRAALRVNQQTLALLTGISSVSVNRWEQGRAVPKGFNVAFLEFLEEAIALYPADDVRRTLRRAGGEPAALMRALVWMTQQEAPPSLRCATERHRASAVAPTAATPPPKPVLPDCYRRRLAELTPAQQQHGDPSSSG